MVIVGYQKMTEQTILILSMLPLMNINPTEIVAMRRTGCENLSINKWANIEKFTFNSVPFWGVGDGQLCWQTV